MNNDSSLIYSTVENTVLSVYGVNSIEYEENDKKGNADRGIVMRRVSDNKLVIDVYLVVNPDIKITEVLRECQNQLRYVLDKNFKQLFKSVNVYAKRLAISE